ncbi:hypothetical protein NBO_43g0011 [Nosema bombycis CQ1]|uniref:Uncharacterized protein n=1 Tax=Nosema bombycis (strain CQ1 / CVCC 102059) TaxID=578461 RepID=R0KT80_NOSB1|nr:hypothetical protein NBO_43g0011 [Nosema bombycis CQ1]|eukprot:EOB14006.1 hypothetical protein NBO_43g0011 [Nosema bombycis CQ1]
MQIIEPNLKLDTFTNINSYFKEPLTLKIGITSLKLFLFKSKIEIGLSFFKKIIGMCLCDLEKKMYSHEIEQNFVKFIRKEEILNEKFKEILYKEIENFLNYLFGLNCEDFKKFLIMNLIFNCFPLCLCEFDTKKIEKSKYFYLVKWMVL